MSSTRKTSRTSARNASKARSKSRTAATGRQKEKTKSKTAASSARTSSVKKSTSPAKSKTAAKAKAPTTSRATAKASTAKTSAAVKSPKTETLSKAEKAKLAAAAKAKAEKEKARAAVAKKATQARKVEKKADTKADAAKTTKKVAAKVETTVDKKLDKKVETKAETTKQKAAVKQPEKKAISTPAAKPAPVVSVASAPVPPTPVSAGVQATAAAKPAFKTPEVNDTVTQKKAMHAPAPAAVPSAPAPAAVSDKAPIAKPMDPAAVAKPVAPKVEVKAPAPKPGAHRTGFKANEFIVYPAHGVGQILAIEEQEVAGYKLELFVINFAKDKMTLKVPLPKVISGAIRKLSDGDTVRKALDTLTGRARVKRTMWSRRAQEYEAKINSGDLSSIAEVVRDLYRSEAQPEQSYSERQLYESALDRMTREIAAVQKLTETEALKLIEAQLQKGPKRGGKNDPADAAADADADVADEGDIEQAA